MMGQSGFISPQPRLRKFNNVLFLSTLLLGLYIVVAPFAPEVLFSVNPALRAAQKFLGIGNNSITTQKVVDGQSEPIPDDNRLVVPQIDVDGPLLEGTSVNLLEKGIWRRPKSSTPDQGSNTVLVAHRFLYTSGPNTFYHLDKLKVGDEFTIYWDHKKYTYKVYETKTVPPTAFEIEAPTKDSVVTLWTCTPIFTATNRLVVRAKLLES
jgi:LPXTG-site transpeptidase (sortase) family protein